jgi:phosphoribosyl 1,2-cyclic phosphodiesterase
MKLVFLGTRGFIEPRSRRHRRHTATLVEYRGRRVLVDCGEDWRGRFQQHRPDAIVITHAHPDHAGGLADGAPCPVYATREAWRALDAFPLRDRHVVAPRRRRRIAGQRYTFFPVAHSERAPAGGWRITAGRVTVFYVPDVVHIPDRDRALAGCELYVGDGAAITRSLVRRPGGALIGHTPVRTQLTWCAKTGVPRMVVTHCGQEIVRGGDRAARRRLAPLADERGVEVAIAHDGMELVLR